MDSICYIEHITDPRPYILFVSVDEEIENIEYEEFHHCVVEVSPFEVSWYDMVDFETNTRWRFDVDYTAEFDSDDI